MDIIMMPPYVEKESRQLIEQAEKMLEGYNELLISRLKKEISDYGYSTNPHPNDIRKAERQFYDDPMRMYLVKHLSTIKGICERPRFMIKATED